MLDRQLRSVETASESGLVAFLEGVDYTVEDRGYETPCHIWQRWIDPQGYGRTTVAFPERRAHRESYRQANGSIPKGQHVHHRCEVEACINADHLELTLHGIHLAYHKQEASSLTWDDVRAIRQAVKDGERQQDIRARYGIAQPTLSDIVTNTTWKDPSYTQGRPVMCDECGETFSAFKANQRFCCREHRMRFNGRKTWRRKHWGSEVRDAA